MSGLQELESAIGRHLNFRVRADRSVAQRALFDAIAQAMSGLMSLTGKGEPTLTGTFIADYVAGLHGVIGTLLALQHRERSAVGRS